MQSQLGFGESTTYKLFLLIINCLMNIACFFVLLFDMHVIYFVFIIVH